MDAAVASDAALNPGKDASVEPSKDASVPDAASDATAPGPTLDDCFANLPAPVGVQMVATKSSSDGHLRLRIALDTMGNGGTSGTYSWALIRLGVEKNGTVSCIIDAANSTYTCSHHNCADKASATAGTMTFDLTSPDRSAATLTMRDGVTVVEDSVPVEDTSCTMSRPLGPAQCQSGAPCD